MKNYIGIAAKHLKGKIAGSRIYNALARQSKAYGDENERAERLQLHIDRRIEAVMGREHEVNRLEAELERAREEISELTGHRDAYRAVLVAMDANRDLSGREAIRYHLTHKKRNTIILDRNGEIASVDAKKLTQRLGYESSGLILTDFLGMMHPRDAEVFGATLKRGRENPGLAGFTMDVGIKYHEQEKLAPYEIDARFDREQDSTEISEVVVELKRKTPVSDSSRVRVFPIHEVVKSSDDGLKVVQHIEESARRGDSMCINAKRLGPEDVGYIQALSGLLRHEHVSVSGIKWDSIYTSARELDVLDIDRKIGMQEVRENWGNGSSVKVVDRRDDIDPGVLRPA